MAKKGASHVSQTERLVRIEGQIRGVVKMIEEKRYCIDILTQMKSMRSALKKVETEIVRTHIEDCVRSAIESGSPKTMQKHVREIATLLDGTL